MKWQLSNQFYIEQLPDGTSFEMIKIEGGLFNSRDGKVIMKEFWIGKFPVTQELWRSIMGDNPVYFKDLIRPVEQVSWEQTQLFLQKLNEVLEESYRLPTEAEWEYAARGGKFSCGFRFAGSDKLKEVGWYRNNAHRETKPVGLKLPNELGIFDMSGNVFEWCADRIGTGRRKIRAIRGGAWLFNDLECGVGSADGYKTGVGSYCIGFRFIQS